MSFDFNKIQELLGSDSEGLLSHVSKTIPKENIHLPGGDFVDRVMVDSDRNPNVLRSIRRFLITDAFPGPDISRSYRLIRV